MWRFNKKTMLNRLNSYERFQRWVRNSSMIRRKIGVVNRGCGIGMGTFHIVSNPQKIGDDLWAFYSKACSGCPAGGTMIKVIDTGINNTNLKGQTYCAFLLDPIVIRSKEELKEGQVVKMKVPD